MIILVSKISVQITRIHPIIIITMILKRVLQ